MHPPHNPISSVSYTHLGCDAHITLDLNAPTVNELDYTELAVMTDAQTEYSDTPSMTVSAYDSYDKFIDVINKGYGELDYEITATSDALVFDKTEGTAYGSDRVRVSVDKSKAGSGTSQATVTVSQLLNGEVVDSKDIAVTIENPEIPSDANTYIEAGGVVSIEAEHYSNTGTNGEHSWQLEKDFGRSGDSMKVYPEISGTVDDADIKTSSAYLEYNVYFTNAGTYTWDVYRMPTLDERGASRVAVAIDDGAPVSYTHLDVYKRQIYTSTVRSPDVVSPSQNSSISCERVNVFLGYDSSLYNRLNSRTVSGISSPSRYAVRSSASSLSAPISSLRLLAIFARRSSAPIRKSSSSRSTGFVI